MLYYMTHTYIFLSHEMCYVLVLNATIERSLPRAFVMLPDMHKTEYIARLTDFQGPLSYWPWK